MHVMWENKLLLMPHYHRKLQNLNSDCLMIYGTLSEICVEWAIHQSEEFSARSVDFDKTHLSKFQVHPEPPDLEFFIPISQMG